MKTVVHCKKDDYDIYIGRGKCPKTGKYSQWKNPFVMGKDGNRKEVIEQYMSWFVTQEHLILDLPLLYNKILGCWCAPKACHGNYLSSMAYMVVTLEDIGFWLVRNGRKLDKDNPQVRKIMMDYEIWRINPTHTASKSFLEQSINEYIKNNKYE